MGNSYGWKVLYRNSETGELESALSCEWRHRYHGLVRTYHVGRWTKPIKGCGPLTVFRGGGEEGFVSACVFGRANVPVNTRELWRVEYERVLVEGLRKMWITDQVPILERVLGTQRQYNGIGRYDNLLYNVYPDSRKRWKWDNVTFLGDIPIIASWGKAVDFASKVKLVEKVDVPRWTYEERDILNWMRGLKP